jgi:hypothetical protein
MCFYQSHIRNFTIGELKACSWYLEMARKFAPKEEMDEQVAVASNTPVPEDLSNDVLEPEVPLEEVKAALPTEKKLNKKKMKATNVVEIQRRALRLKLRWCLNLF